MNDDKRGTPPKKTLTDEDIVTSKPIDEDDADPSRRKVLGTLLATGALAAVAPGCVVRRGAVVYTQPVGAAVVAVPAGRYRTGVTDNDGGPYADPAGYGRGVRRTAYTGITDSDGGPYADPAGYGRGVYGRTTGITDSDGGPYADPVGNGRGTARLGYTGITDSDGGPYADPAGHGRGRWR